MNKKFICLAILTLILIPSVTLAATDWSFSVSSGTGGGGWSVGNIMGYGLPSGSITGIIANILLWILRIFAIIGVIGFVISGILYLTAAGSEERMESAKKAMLYSIIGVIVGLAGVVIIQAVDLALNSISGF